MLCWRCSLTAASCCSIVKQQTSLSLRDLLVVLGFRYNSRQDDGTHTVCGINFIDVELLYDRL